MRAALAAMAKVMLSIIFRQLACGGSTVLAAPQQTLVLVGPSGVGKTTVLEPALEAFPGRFCEPVMTTDRGARPVERDGVDYHFVSTAAFGKMTREGKFMAISPHNGKQYALAKEDFDRCVGERKIVLVQHVTGASAQAMRQGPFFAHATFVLMTAPGDDMQAKMEVIRGRLGGRGTEDSESLRARLDSARKEMELADVEGLWDLVLVNDEVPVAVDQLRQFLEHAFQIEPSSQVATAVGLSARRQQMVTRLVSLCASMLCVAALGAFVFSVRRRAASRGQCSLLLDVSRPTSSAPAVAEYAKLPA